MGRVPITIMGYKCERCGHEWLPRDENREPKVCPKCKSPYWDTPKKKQVEISFEEFSGRIKTVLKASATPMTWTEVRTEAKLPQKFPNNQWVHKMDREMGLIREKDNHGIIHWRLSK